MFACRCSIKVMNFGLFSEVTGVTLYPQAVRSTLRLERVTFFRKKDLLVYMWHVWLPFISRHYFKQRRNNGPNLWQWCVVIAITITVNAAVYRHWLSASSLSSELVVRWYTLRVKKGRHDTLVHIFAKYCPIFTILSPMYSVGNLQ